MELLRDAGQMGTLDEILNKPLYYFHHFGYGSAKMKKRSHTIMTGA